MKSNKKHIHTLILLLILSISGACNVLDVEPADEISAEEAFKTKSDIEKGIIGSYSELQSLSYYGRTYLIFSDLAADNLMHPDDATSSDYAEVDNNTLLPENSAIDGIWSAIYSAINVDNSIIDKVPDIAGMTDSEKAAALGELYFLRALNHFNLMNFFGAIPIKTTPTVGTDSLDAPRKSTDEVFTQIISDLTYAETNLEASNSTKTRATKYTATALLARVYLYQKNYTKAYEKANEVITDGGYSFLTDYADIFATEGNAEVIFEVEFDELDRNRIAEYNYPKTLNGRYEVKPDPTLIAAYESGDERLSASIAYSGTNAYACKYTDLSLGDKNIIVLRLTEMYLIRAEAEAHLSTGVISNIKADVNKIRHRAGLEDTDAATKSELILAIEKERQVEFAFEGHRWFDLVRTGRAVDVLPNVTKSTQTLFPIPLSELNTNNSEGMTQNPGY
jgi:starch-binding outer membrane protein, SusD/RagB family